MAFGLKPPGLNPWRPRQAIPVTKPKPAPPIASALGSAMSTLGGPAAGIAADVQLAGTGPSVGALAAKQAGTQALAQAMPANPLKQIDHGLRWRRSRHHEREADPSPV
jgi:hypothetical protein